MASYISLVKYDNTFSVEIFPTTKCLIEQANISSIENGQGKISTLEQAMTYFHPCKKMENSCVYRVDCVEKTIKFNTLDCLGMDVFELN